MIAGFGCDILEIERIRNILSGSSGERFLNRFFTNAEQDYVKNSPERAAGRFCAKEAAAKALATGFSGFSPADIEILNDKRGKPRVRFLNAARSRFKAIGARRAFLTISHSRQTALAVCVIEGRRRARVKPIEYARAKSAPDGRRKSAMRIAPPRRPPDAHKGCFGKVVCAAGSLKYAGAAALCALAALRAGCGYVYACVPEPIAGVLRILAPEAITVALPHKNGFFCEDSFEPLSDCLKRCDCALIGPGIGTEAFTARFVDLVLKNASSAPYVIDADALNLITPDALCPLKNVCVTPHLKEFARLTGGAVSLTKPKIRHALSFAQKYNTVTLLKGKNTCVAAPDGRVYINDTGSTALAKAGSGDVLSGVIASFAAQKSDLFEACALGAKIHGLAGDIAAAVLTEYGVLPRDVAANVPLAIKKLLRSY